jgi:hypothetical protein
MRAAKKHAKVLLFSELGKYFHLKVTLFPYFFGRKIKIAKPTLQNQPYFRHNSTKKQALTQVINNACTSAHFIIYLAGYQRIADNTASAIFR